MAKLPKGVNSLINQITTSDYETVKKNRRPGLGTMGLYYYPDPKTAATLEVFDQLPFVFFLGFNAKYLWGLNIHYFDWAQRLKFMKYLNQRGGKLRYSDVKKAFKAGTIPLGLAAYCYRLYLISHVKSNMKLFDLTDNEEYDDAYKIAKLVLPRFKGKSDSQVFKDIRTRFKQSQKK